MLYHWRELATSVGFDINAKSYAQKTRAGQSARTLSAPETPLIWCPLFFHRAIYPIPEPARLSV